MTDDAAAAEEYHVEGDDLIKKVKDLIHEGNIRRLIIKNEEGKKLIEIPLTLGVVGAVLLPVWAAIGAIAAVVTDCTIEVERTDEAAAE
jgi:CBS domain-containing protein